MLRFLLGHGLREICFWVFDWFYFDAVEIIFSYSILEEIYFLIFYLLPVARVDS